MKILVCVKQVPGSNNVEVDPVTGVLKRSGVPSKINPYDLYGKRQADPVPSIPRPIPARSWILNGLSYFSPQTADEKAIRVIFTGH